MCLKCMPETCLRHNRVEWTKYMSQACLRHIWKPCLKLIVLTLLLFVVIIPPGHETKAMLNNSGPRAKRSKLERDINAEVASQVLLLFGLCLLGAVCKWRERERERERESESERERERVCVCVCMCVHLSEKRKESKFIYAITFQ